MTPEENKAIAACARALQLWLHSQDPSGEISSIALAEVLGCFIGRRAGNENRLYEGYNIYAALVKGYAEATFADKQ